MFGINIVNLPEDEFYEVWPDNVQAFQLFQQLQTQWVLKPMGGISGLNYSSVMTVINLYSNKHKKRLFEDIQAIEVGFLSTISNGK